MQWLPTCLAAGATVLMPAFDAGQWLSAIAAERISVLTAVPAMYWLALQRSETTARVLSDGWLHTGDVARITGDGAIQLLDRRDDVVNRGGENVYCTEVENALAAHSAVAEVGVVGVPDDALDRKVAVAVVPLPGAEVSPAALVRFARGVLADFKVPSTSACVPSRCPGTRAARWSSSACATRPTGGRPLW